MPYTLSPSGMDKARSMHNSTAATLWAHLSRKDALGPTTATLDPGSFVPPSGPQDKTATTMRVLLHDTQMNLEKFSGNVERLATDVQSAAQSIKQTSSAFEQEHDKLMGDIVNLVNRVQTRILDSIGTPAQSLAVAELFKDVDQRLQCLDQRLVASQTFSQTHSQALQTQMTALQALQSQQNLIVAAVTPLLPLLQLVQSSLACTRHSTAPLSPAAPASAASKPSLKPPSSVITISSDDSPKYVRKRSRSIVETHALSSPSTSGVARKKLRSGSSRSPSGSAVASSSSAAAQFPNQKRSLQTPRRPLQEIYFQSPRLAFTPKQAEHLPVPKPHERAGPSAKKPWKINPSPGTGSRLDRIVRQMSVQQNASSGGNQVPSIPSSTPRRQLASTPRTNGQGAGNRTGSRQRPHPRAFETGMRSTESFALPGLPRQPTLGAATTSQLLNAPVPLSTVERMPAPSLIPMRNKDNASLKEGKRFIPLVDTDEEDDEE